MMIKKSLTIFTVFFFCCVGMAMAGDRIQDKDQDQKRDGSCLEDAIDSAPDLKLAADRMRDKDQDRKRDGSCLL